MHQTYDDVDVRFATCSLVKVNEVYIPDFLQNNPTVDFSHYKGRNMVTLGRIELENLNATTIVLQILSVIFACPLENFKQFWMFKDRRENKSELLLRCCE